MSELSEPATWRNIMLLTMCRQLIWSNGHSPIRLVMETLYCCTSSAPGFGRRCSLRKARREVTGVYALFGRLAQVGCFSSYCWGPGAPASTFWKAGVNLGFCSVGSGEHDERMKPNRRENQY